jgi:hypothetical protein
VRRGRPAGSGNIPWGAIVARLREQPETWMLLSELASVSDRTIQTVRLKERKALRMDDGEIRVRRKSVAVDTQGRTIVTLYAQFKPKESHGSR